MTISEPDTERPKKGRFERWTHWLAFGLGSGTAPSAPGTMGSLAALLVLPVWAVTPIWAQLLWVVATFMAGILVCGQTARDLGEHDHPGIVFDEFVGIWVAFVAVPITPLTVVVGFLLFRLFDIWKPWPITWLDKRVQGGFGIMVDDLVAGLAAMAVMHLLVQFAILPGL